MAERRTARSWQFIKAAGEAYGVWQLLAALGVTSVIGSLAIALVAQLRDNLNWFGQASFVIGLFLLSLVAVRLIAPAVIRRLAPAMGYSVPDTLSDLVNRVRDLEKQVKHGQFDINIRTDSDAPPSFSVIPVRNPSHRYWGSGLSLRQYRAQLGTDTQIVMQLIVAIHAVPKMLVEQMELELMDTTHPCINWTSEYMLTDYERELEFIIPDSVTPGIHTVRVVARVNGEPKYSARENVNFPER